MEMTKEYVKIQEEKNEAIIVKKKGYPLTIGKNDRIEFKNGSVLVSYNGEVMGTVDSVTMENDMRLTREDFDGFRLQDRTMTMNGSFVDYGAMYEELRKLLEEDRTYAFSMSNIYDEIHQQRPNREERRKTDKQRRQEEKENKYAKNIRNLLGGKKSRWN